MMNVVSWRLPGNTVPRKKQEAPARCQGVCHHNQPKMYHVSRQTFILCCLVHSEPELLLVSADLVWKPGKAKIWFWAIWDSVPVVDEGAGVNEGVLSSRLSLYHMRVGVNSILHFKKEDWGWGGKKPEGSDRAHSPEGICFLSSHSIEMSESCHLTALLPSEVQYLQSSSGSSQVLRPCAGPGAVKPAQCSMVSSGQCMQTGSSANFPSRAATCFLLRIWNPPHCHLCVKDICGHLSRIPGGTCSLTDSKTSSSLSRGISRLLLWCPPVACWHSRRLQTGYFPNSEWKPDLPWRNSTGLCGIVWKN